jgi:hypothetical protein
MKSWQIRDPIGVSAQDEACLTDHAEGKSGGFISESRTIRAVKKLSQRSCTWHMRAESIYGPSVTKRTADLRRTLGIEVKSAIKFFLGTSEQ